MEYEALILREMSFSILGSFQQMPLGFLTESERRVDPRGTQIFSIKSLSVLLFEQVSRADNLKLGQATAQLTKCNCIIF